eukprot:scaffold270607_cov36-Tisochrysis_lutea.AAC.2
MRRTAPAPWPMNHPSHWASLVHQNGIAERGQRGALQPPQQHRIGVRHLFIADDALERALTQRGVHPAADQVRQPAQPARAPAPRVCGVVAVIFAAWDGRA